MTLPARLRQLQRDTGGTALIELTILAPLLISLMCGLAEFGQVLRQYHVMQKGVQDAAHYLARAPTDPCAAGGPDANWVTYIGEAKNLAIYGKTTSGTPLYKGWANPATVAVSKLDCLANPRTNGAALPRITVTANAPYVDLGMLGFLGVGPITLSVSHQELKVS